MMISTGARVFSTSNCAVRWARISNGIPSEVVFSYLHITNSDGIKLCCDASTYSWSGKMILYSMYISKGACFDAAVKLWPCCVVNGISHGPRSPANSSKALMVALAKFVQGWFWCLEFLAEINLTGAIATCCFPSLVIEFLARRMSKQTIFSNCNFLYSNLQLIGTKFYLFVWFLTNAFHELQIQKWQFEKRLQLVLF